jgi:hypothetical protein
MHTRTPAQECGLGQDGLNMLPLFSTLQTQLRLIGVHPFPPAVI